MHSLKAPKNWRDLVLDEDSHEGNFVEIDFKKIKTLNDLPELISARILAKKLNKHISTIHGYMREEDGLKYTKDRNGRKLTTAQWYAEFEWGKLKV